jgi:hypothetical protein
MIPIYISQGWRYEAGLPSLTFSSGCDNGHALLVEKEMPLMQVVCRSA